MNRILIVVGLIALIFGGISAGKGYTTYNEIQNELVAEENYLLYPDGTPEDQRPRNLIDNADEARQTSLVIRSHTLDRYGPYSSMERTDPNRDTYIKGVSLRNALNMAAMGFGVAQFIMATGAMFILIGGSLILVGVKGRV